MQTSRQVLLALLMLLVSAPMPADEIDDREALRAEIELLQESGILSGRGVGIAAIELIAEVYANRNFAPAWTSPEQAARLLAAVEATSAEGLDPADYYVDGVREVHRELIAGFTDAGARATADILLTEALIRVGYHQLYGKVDPSTLNPNWNFRRDLNGIDPVALVQELIDSPILDQRLSNLVPRGWLYLGLKEALARYRQIRADGGWGTVPEGPTLRPGAADSRLAALAARLAVTGDLDGASDFANYDAVLEAGVRRFQQRHALAVDGVIGPATIRALNVPVDARIRQLELSLERARWVMNGLEDDFVLVNIAGFEAYVVRGRDVSWSTRVQVGRNYRQSPIFRDEIKYLVFNPTWTVPYSIASQDILPQVQRDASYLSSRGFTVMNRDGEAVDPAGIDWSALSRRNFPYTLVQGPGPENALGRVKFMFPNEHSVYLHDTPSRALFESADRAFSSGCIRVEHPFELAELLLGPTWTQERLAAVIESGEITTVRMPAPLPVLLLYWTAEVTPDGSVEFFQDVYDRDAALDRALDLPFRIYPRDE